MKVLSLDIGRNKTGVAISEESIGLVTPLEAVRVSLNTSTEEWFRFLVGILAKKKYELYQIDTVVIGSWEDSDYKNSEMKKLVEKAIKVLETRTDWKVKLIRETYTSIDSREILKGMGVKGKKLYRSLDSYAATLLLIDYLELVRPLEEKNTEYVK